MMKSVSPLISESLDNSDAVVIMAAVSSDVASAVSSVATGAVAQKVAGFPVGRFPEYTAPH